MLSGLPFFFWWFVRIAELALVLHYPYLLSLVSPLLSSGSWDLRYSQPGSCSCETVVLLQETGALAFSQRCWGMLEMETSCTTGRFGGGCV